VEPAVRATDGGLSTRAVHAGRVPEVDQAPVAPPIHPASTWAVRRSEDLAALLSDQLDGYVYGRYDNPTNSALHAQVAALHHTEAAWSLASGTAAIHAAVASVRHRPARGPGRILASERLYGGTHALFTRLAATAGWEVDRVDLTVPGAVARAAGGDHAVVYAETIANPTTTVLDLPALARDAAAHDLALVVDNTFASPWLCRPAALGGDHVVVVESATKHLGGHGDVVAGVVAGTRRQMAAVREITYELGASLGPFEAWLVSRGIQTLALRVERSSATALVLARDLAADDRVAAVHYPGLADHPQHALARRLFDRRGFGATFAFDLGSRAAARAFADACRVFTRAASLGGTHSLVIHPASTTHRQLDDAELAAAGIGAGLVRLSVGIEDAEDLRADVAGALDAAT
jgi:cystathionine beta-lyase/cystathionine gamma-synthase